jgi:biotin carboxyl carrier protein
VRYVATVDGESFPISAEKRKDLLLIEINGKKHSLDFKSTPGSSLHSMIVGGKQYEIVIERGENGLSVYVDGETHSVQISEGAKALPRKESRGRIEVKAAMPGLVVAVEVKAGQKVEKEDGLLILEAMKMQNEVKTPQRGTVADVHVKEGSAVEKGEKLVTIQT